MVQHHCSSFSLAPPQDMSIDQATYNAFLSTLFIVVCLVCKKVSSVCRHHSASHRTRSVFSPLSRTCSGPVCTCLHLSALVCTTRSNALHFIPRLRRTDHPGRHHPLTHHLLHRLPAPQARALH